MQCTIAKILLSFCYMMRAALARGMRRLDAALSNDLLKDNDETENPFGARTKSAEESHAKFAKSAKF